MQLHAKKVEVLLEQKYSCTGFAFVTFNSEAAVNACMEAINHANVPFIGR